MVERRGNWGLCRGTREKREHLREIGRHRMGCLTDAYVGANRQVKKTHKSFSHAQWCIVIAALWRLWQD